MKVGDISRRDFMKLSGAGIIGLNLAPHFDYLGLASFKPFQGRVVDNNLNIRETPSFQGRKVNSLQKDNVIEIVEEVFGGVDGDYNRTWYRMDNGFFVYSGYVQQVDTNTNDTVFEIHESGVLGEITVPYADSYWGINRNPSPGPRLYYGTTHWITEMVFDQRDGSPMYKAYDNLWSSNYYIPAHWIHIFSNEELTPLSPLVPENKKQIEISKSRQLLVAYEWDVPVYSARIASGRNNFETPTGTFHTFHKRPTYHMAGGPDEESVFDLPGVPWDSYITESGVAIHGTYWHNDFGKPHSHGCINMRIQDAKWIFRWTTPSIQHLDRKYYQPGEGTLVKINLN